MLEKTLTVREICDLEMLLTQGFYPLKGFLSSKDYHAVIETNRLAEGTIWPIPINLSLTEEETKQFSNQEKIVLKNEFGLKLAYLFVEDIYQYDLAKECQSVFGAYDVAHPYIQWQQAEYDKGKKYYIGGKVEKINGIVHSNFLSLRKTPLETRTFFQKQGWEKVIAFQTRNPIHKAHFEITQDALQQIGTGATLFLNPIVGNSQNEDIPYQVRVRSYLQLLKHYNSSTTYLSLLPLSMRMAGPKEALWHCCIRKNYGAHFFIVGRDHAGPTALNSNKNPFYGQNESLEYVEKYQDEIGIKIISIPPFAYNEKHKKYGRLDSFPKNEIASISGTEFRSRIINKKEIPSWFSFPEVTKEIAHFYNTQQKKGFCLYLIGIPSSGKTTYAHFLKEALLEYTHKNISILDGDEVRERFSKELGFSRADRSINIRRIGHLAGYILYHKGICITANIAPFQEDREYNRKHISNYGQYIEIHVKTSLACCIQRDPKSLYKKAIAGEIKNLTGYNDTFEDTQSDIVINGEAENPHTEIAKIIQELKNRKLL